MEILPALLPDLIVAIDDVISANAEEVTALDQAIGDGDHVTNLQRGILALKEHQEELVKLDWSGAWQKTGMILMSSVGGASGSLYGTFFLAMSKAAREKPLSLKVFSEVFAEGVESIKKRGKADVGEKTMLDVLVPVSEYIKQATAEAASVSVVLEKIPGIAVTGMESTRDMLATKGRASFLGNRTKGHIDAGAKTAQLMICAVVDVIKKNLASPS